MANKQSAVFFVSPQNVHLTQEIYSDVVEALRFVRLQGKVSKSSLHCYILSKLKIVQNKLFSFSVVKTTNLKIYTKDSINLN